MTGLYIVCLGSVDPSENIIDIMFANFVVLKLNMVRKYASIVLKVKKHKSENSNYKLAK